MSLGIFSFFANLLILTGPLFMLQVYDRVPTSGSIPTLLALAMLVGILYVVYGFLEFIRSRFLVRIGRIVDEAVRERVFHAVAMQALRGMSGTRSEPLTDLQTIRQFLQSNDTLAFLDMPWAPICSPCASHTALSACSTIRTMSYLKQCETKFNNCKRKAEKTRINPSTGNSTKGGAVLAPSRACDLCRHASK